MPYFILLGAPGSGKGTQAGDLARALDVVHVSTGDLFREHIGQGTELGTLAKTFMDRGELVPDDVTIKMLLDRLARDDAANGAVLDGFPRTVPQAQALDVALSKQGSRVTKTLYLVVPDQELIRRLSSRWLCKTCATPYHTMFNPPKIAGVCDKDGGTLYQRPDDTPETAIRRLEVFKQQTLPLIQYYQQQGKLEEVDGSGDIATVGQALQRAAGTAASAT